MKTTEILTPETVDAMPDAELLHRMQRLRVNVASLRNQIIQCRENPYGRATDWTVRADSRLKDMEAALQQVREEGKRRLEAARGQAASTLQTEGDDHVH